jgi:hypothetical protein
MTFDGDGVEDILVSAASYADEGSYRTYSLLLLSRTGLAAKFKVRNLGLPPDDPWAP